MDKGSQMQGVYALPSQKTADGKRKWDKKQSCVFCSKLYPKLPRHLEKIHSKEVEVQRALAFEKGSKERKEAWKSMRNKGNFAHNMMVYNQGKGQVIPCKRPRTSIEGTKYIQCKECKGTYRRSELWRHVKAAHSNKNGEKQRTKNSHQLDSAALLPVSNVAT